VSVVARNGKKKKVDAYIRILFLGFFENGARVVEKVRWHGKVKGVRPSETSAAVPKATLGAWL
jgi:hypothetical protein